MGSRTAAARCAVLLLLVTSSPALAQQTMATRIVAGDQTLVVGNSTRFEAAVWGEGPNILLDPTFSSNRTWQLVGREIGNDSLARAQMTGDGSVTIVFGPAAAPGTVYIWQRTPLPAPGNYSFTVTTKDEGSVAYDIILTEVGFNATQAGLKDARHNTNFRANSTLVAQRHTWEWSPRFNDSTHVHVYLRFRVANGTSGVVSFEDISLSAIGPAPLATTLSWSVPGLSGVSNGSGFVVDASAPGLFQVFVNASSPDGASASESRPLLVLPAAVEPLPTLDGRVVLRWSLPAGLDARFQWRVGALASEALPAVASELGGWRAFELVVDAPPARQAGALVASAPGLGSFELARVAPSSLRAPLGVPVVASPLALLGEGVRVSVVVLDPFAVNVSASLVDASGRVVGRTLLASEGGGTFSGVVPAPAGGLFRDLRVVVAGENVFGGTQTVVAEGVVHVTPVRGLDVADPAVLVLLAACVFALGWEARARWRRRDA